jgi:hypothetical protein
MNWWRSSSPNSPSWFHPSQVFTDTQRVDLFDDPKWETMSHRTPRSSSTEHVRRPFGRTKDNGIGVRRVLMKQGRHSRRLA